MPKKRFYVVTDAADYLSLFVFRKLNLFCSAYSISYLVCFILSLVFENVQGVCGPPDPDKSQITLLQYFAYGFFMLIEVLRLLMARAVVHQFNGLFALLIMIISIVPELPLLIISLVFTAADRALLVLGLIEALVVAGQDVALFIFFRRIVRVWPEAYGRPQRGVEARARQ